MGGFGIWELLIILVIVALLFGTKKLKTIGGDLGGAVKGFRSAVKDEDTDNIENQDQPEQAIESGQDTNNTSSS